jgi:hypothetical protein
VHDLKIFGQGIDENDDQKSEKSGRQVRDQTIGFLAALYLT